MNDASLPDSFFEEHLKTIEREISSAKNRVRYSMNGALIAIGSRNESLEKKAISAARRIGKVDVDHGETGCKTPDAEPYIVKTRAQNRTSAAPQEMLSAVDINALGSIFRIRPTGISRVSQCLTS